MESLEHRNQAISRSYTKIKCGTSEAFLNDVGVWRKPTTHFHPRTISLQGLVQHVTSGKAFVPNYYTNSAMRREYFLSSQLLVLDFASGRRGNGVKSLAADPFNKEYALLIYPAVDSDPRKPKTRVIYLLSEACDQFEMAEFYTERLAYKFASRRPSDSSIFYGSSRRDYVVNYNAVLPFDVLLNLPEVPRKNAELLPSVGGLPKPIAPIILPPPPPIAPPIARPIPPSRLRKAENDRRISYVLAAHESNMAEIRLACVGNRNATLAMAAGKSFQLSSAAADVLTHTQVEADATRAAIGLGDPEIRATLMSAFRFAVAQPRELPQFVTPGKRNRKKKADSDPDLSQASAVQMVMFS